MEQTVSAPIPQVMEGIVESEYVPPAPAVARRRRAGKSVASAPAVTFSALASVIEYVASSSAVICAAPAPVIECVAPSPAVACAAPAPVVEYVWHPHLPLLMQHQLQ